MHFDSELIESARQRTIHITKAIEWYAQEFQNNDNFQTIFATMIRALDEASSVNLNTPGIKHQLICTGIGKSGGIANLVANMFISVGVLARFLHPSEAVHGDLGGVFEHDTVLCISNSGNSQELLSLLPKLRERSCRIFGISARTDSPLSQLCDYMLPLPPFEEACPLNQTPITSTITALALCQLMVAASIEHRSFGVDNYARNHPGGTIGKRIYLTVHDLMTKSTTLPKVSSHATFPECISALTKYAMSVILVTDNDYLQGIISERDIRIAMEKHGKSVFEKTALELMNPNPITIEQNLLAIDALKIMQERPRPLNFLPVVTPDHKIAGLLRLHDLVNAGINLV